MLKQKLMNRVFPVILSVAMVLETVPVTAYAAEYEESMTTEETVLEESVDVSENAESLEESSSSTGEEYNKETEKSKGAALDTKIIVDESALESQAQFYHCKYDIDEKVVVAKYDANNSNPFAEILSEIKSGNNVISVTVDGETQVALKNKLSFQWQKADATVIASDAAPAEAGSYTLVIVLDAEENVCSKTETKIAFRIAKRNLSIALVDEYVMPGMTVGEWKSKFDYRLNRETTDYSDDSNEDISEDKTTYINSISLEVYDAYQTQTALADDTKLVDGSDYVAIVKPTLKPAVITNYKIPEEIYLNFKTQDLIETEVTAVQKDAGELIAKIYSENSKISYETDIKDKLNISVTVYDSKADKKTEIPNVTVTQVWFDAAKLELGEGAEFEPTDAGTYYIGFRYYPAEEDENIYKAYKDATANLIKVVIEKAPLTLKPALKSEAETFYTGMTEADVLKYADYTLLDANNNEVTIDKDTFWGVSYDDIQGAGIYDDTTSTQQSYEPVFCLVRSQKSKSDDTAKDAATDTEWMENNGDELDASKYFYRLVFTGKKTVYTTVGDAKKLLDVNGSDIDAEDKNHAIVTTKEVLSANYVDISVEEVKKTTIDVSNILEENFNTKNLSDFYKPTKLVSKIYNGEGLYEARKDYKQATVKTEDGEEVAANFDSAISYTWYKITGTGPVYDETDPENPVQTGWEVSKKRSLLENTVPSAAGEYMLEICFSKTGYASCAETIYYRIDKQILVVGIESIPTAYKDQTVARYAQNVDIFGEYNVYIVPDNQYSESIKTEDTILKDWYQVPFDGDLSEYDGDCYKLNWYVEQVQLEADNTPVKDESGKLVYTKLGSNSKLCILEPDTYRLGVTLTSNNSNYTNYAVIYDAKMSPTPAYESKYYNDDVPITVGEATAITIEVDETKLVTSKGYDGKPFYASEEEAENVIKNAITIKNADTGDVIAQDQWPELLYDIKDKQANTFVDFEEMKYGGEYTVFLLCVGDKTYRSAYAEILYTINKVALTVTPALMEKIPAGTDCKGVKDGVIYDLSKTEFVGYVETDAEAFQYGKTVIYDEKNNDTKTLGFGAYYYEDFDEDIYKYQYHQPQVVVTKVGSSSAYNGYVRFNTEYALQLSGNLAYPYSRCYDVNYVRKTFKATDRGNSSASSKGYPKSTYSKDAFPFTKIVQRNDGTTVTVTPVSPISYVATSLSRADAYGNVIGEEGNYLEFEIKAPNEFLEDQENCEKYSKNFAYRSSIEAAGGYVVETFEDITNKYSSTSECIVVFPVKEKEVKSFDIIWENGYTETYKIDLTNVILKEDLTKAVAPKSLAFNGVNTKMAVGDEQQLDVKIKKVQINDIIYIDYRVTQGQDVISVTTDDSKGAAGYVTALKPGKATVAAVPVRLVNGVKTDIAGAKAATVSITVSDVTAPAIKKIVAFDTKIELTYTKPVNGYRREVYILEGKKKAEDFEALIGAVNNGEWRGVFAAKPEYYANESFLDTKAKTVEKKISGLSANKEYTLYVRNVSGIRTLEDGSLVELSSKGTVKNFKTRAPQAEALSLYAKNDADTLVTFKNVALSAKTEQLYVFGQFSTKDIDPAADRSDKSWLTLPLDKAYSKTFVAPKLTYIVSSEPVSVHVKDIRDFKNYTYVKGMYYKKTDTATVDKNGKVTLKGVGKVTITVIDETTGKKDSVTLNIHATADSIKAKDGKLAVGKCLYLSSLLTYYEGKSVINGLDYHNDNRLKHTTYKPNLTILAEELDKINSKGDFAVTDTGDGDYKITALKPNAVCDITVYEGDLLASLKVQSSPIEVVKDFKIADVVDNGFKISFSYPVDTDLSKTQYRIDITDERGNIIDSMMCSASGYDSYDGKKKLYTQQTDDKSSNATYLYYSNKKLARLSKYNVSVTTIVGDEISAKPVKKSVKTTDFPAAYEDRGAALYGGIAVNIYSLAGTRNYAEVLSSRRYLTSGNAYTLKADVKTNAQYRMTDSLTWKSSDTKVASVKAKAGTYTAQLNALKPGSTVIEVTSKITKKVIARYPVFVKAVGNAKEDYYGDYEYTGEYVYQYDAYYTSNVEVLTLQNAVRVTTSERYDEYTDTLRNSYKWVKFTAPAFGEYKFDCDKSVSNMISSLEDDGKTYQNNVPYTMAEGETYYFKIYDAFTMRVSDYAKLNNSFTAEDGSIVIDSDSSQLVEFRATQDNVYTFWSKENPYVIEGISGEDNKKVDYTTGFSADGIDRWYASLSAGETIYLKLPAGQYTLYVEKRNVTVLSDGMQIVLTDEVKEKWYTYTAAEEGLYTFKSKAATSALTASRYESLKDWDATPWNVTKDGNDFTGRMTLKAGDKIIFCISAEEAATATIDVTPEIPVKISVGDETALPVKTENRRWVAFTLPEAGRYRFRAVSTEADAAYDVNLRYYQNAIEENEITSIANGEIVVSDNISNQPDAQAGDTVYVEVTTTKEGTDAANVKVSLTQVTATELAVGETTITMKDGDEYWYTFAQPKEGSYIIQSQVTPNAGADGVQTDTHTLSAAWYTRGLEQKYPGSNSSFDAIGNYDFYDESSYSTSTIRTFRVSADAFGFDADGTGITTTAKIIVKELTATPLEIGMPVDVSLLRNEKRWYSFTAPETETYIFKRSMKEGRVETVYPKSNELGDGTSVEGIDDYYLKDLEAGETFYIREWARYNDAAEFTRLVEGPVKLPAGVPQLVTVTKDAPVWCRYTAEEDNQHALRYDTENITDVAVSYADSLGGYEYTISNGYGDLILSKNDKRYIKLMTTSETPIEVTIQMGPIEPIAVSAGETKEITLEPDQRSTWYSFTAEEAGRYVICKTYESGDDTCMNCYNNLTHPKPAGTLHWFDVTFEQYYEAGETVYIQAYTTASTQQTTSLMIEKVEDAVPMSGTSVDDEPIEKDKKKGYLYTAEKTGLYHFANKGTGYNFCVYMDITDKRFSESQNAGCSGDIFLKENDTVYFGVSASKDTTVKITMEFVSEVQTLSVGEENTVNLSSVEKGTLAAVPIAESGFYDFEIAYSAEGDDIDFADENGKVYYMLGGQIIGGQELEKLQDSAFVESSGTVAFFEKLAMQGDTVYLYLPKLASATGATVTVTKSDTAEVIEVTMKKSGEHTFDISDEAWYVFDVPKDGGYKLTFDLSDSEDTSYFVRRYLNGLDLKTVAYSQTINKDCTVEIQPVKRNQRICFYIEKKTGASNVPLTVWASGV